MAKEGKRSPWFRTIRICCPIPARIAARAAGFSIESTLLASAARCSSTSQMVHARAGARSVTAETGIATGDVSRFAMSCFDSNSSRLM